MRLQTAAAAEVRSALEATGGDGLLNRLAEASPHTRRHSEAVSSLAMRLGTLLVPDAPKVAILLGFTGVLHDVGKVNPEIIDLIEAARPLSAHERLKAKEVHTEEGGRMIEGLAAQNGHDELIASASYVARHHHSRPGALLDGVYGGRSMEIMITSAIHVIDQFEAVQAGDRPYRRNLVQSPEEAANWVTDRVKMIPFFGVAPDRFMAALIDAARVEAKPV